MSVPSKAFCATSIAKVSFKLPMASRAVSRHRAGISPRVPVLGDASHKLKPSQKRRPRKAMGQGDNRLLERSVGKRQKVTTQTGRSGAPESPIAFYRCPRCKGTHANSPPAWHLFGSRNSPIFLPLAVTYHISTGNNNKRRRKKANKKPRAPPQPREQERQGGQIASGLSV